MYKSFRKFYNLHSTIVHSLYINDIVDIVTSPRFIIMLLCDTIHTYMHVMLQQVYTVNMTLSELLLLLYHLDLKKLCTWWAVLESRLYSSS